MKLKNIFFSTAAFLLSLNTFSQTPDKVIDDYFNAIGGRDKIAAVNTMTITGNMEVMGNSAPSTITILNGKGYKSDMNFGGQDIVQSITDKGGWMINPMMGSATPTAIPDEQYKAVKDELYVGGPLLNYKTNGYTVTSEGMESVDGKANYKLKASNGDSATTYFYIDSATHLVTQRVISVGGQTTSIKYSNYQPTDAGIQMAYNEALTIPQGMTINYTITKVEFNKPVDPGFFDMPKQ